MITIRDKTKNNTMDAYTQAIEHLLKNNNNHNERLLNLLHSNNFAKTGK